jgi:hypothetical protein
MSQSTCGAAKPKVNAVTPPRTKVRRETLMGSGFGIRGSGFGVRGSGFGVLQVS